MNNLCVHVHWLCMYYPRPEVHGAKEWLRPAAAAAAAVKNERQQQQQEIEADTNIEIFLYGNPNI